MRNLVISFLLLPFMTDQTVGKQSENLRNLTSIYERDKKYWAAAVKNLQQEIKVNKHSSV